MPEDIFAIGCSENDSRQNQSYAGEPKPATKQKQKQTQTLQWCLDHPEIGVYATLKAVQFGMVLFEALQAEF